MSDLTPQEAALLYVRQGWAVLPIWNMDEGGDCACGGAGSCKPGKHPIWELVPHGVKDASLDGATVGLWFQEYPEANVAIATGQVSGGLVVIDVDPRNGGGWGVLKAALGDLEHSVTVSTGGGGFHVYTQADRAVPGKGNIVPGIDIKGEGGYVIAPPSNHASGGSYALLTAPSIKPCPTPLDRIIELTEPSRAVSGDSGPSCSMKIELPRSFDPHTAAPDREKARMLFLDVPRARKAFDRELTDIDDQSGSGQDLALANAAAGQGWEALEIAQLIAAARRHHGDRPNGRSYYAATAGNAIEAWTGKSETPSELPEIIVEDMYEIADLEIPERELVIDPWLKERQLGLVFAKRGVGKTYFCLSVACAVATGTDLFGWEIPKARRVLYIDGEMDLADLRLRIAGILAGRNAQLEEGKLSILSRDRMMMLGKRLNYLTESTVREAVLNAIPEGTELVVLDNLSCLVGGEENDSQAWDAVQDFILALRFRGIAVVMVHHAAKGGQQRGTSRREDVLDFSIKLESPHDTEEDDPGGRFKVVWSKRRGFSGKDAPSFEARLDVQEDGTVVWTQAEADATQTDRVIEGYWELFNENSKAPTVRQLAEYLELTKSYVHRLVKRAKEEGRI
jgi:hypothetical protein